MDISLSLTPETEKRLAVSAARQGKTIQGLIQDIIENEASACDGSKLTEQGRLEGQANRDADECQFAPDEDHDADETPWRGVFAPAHPRKTLFTTEMQFRIAELPRRAPHVIISPRWVDDDE